MYKTLEIAVYNDEIELDGEYYYPPRHIRNGRLYSFNIYCHPSGGIYSVMGSPLNEDHWEEWKKDTRQRCSLGGIET